jgi:hypothetical protein
MIDIALIHLWTLNLAIWYLLNDVNFILFFDTFGLVTMNCNFQIFGGKHGLYILVYLCQNLDPWYVIDLKSSKSSCNLFEMFIHIINKLIEHMFSFSKHVIFLNIYV